MNSPKPRNLALWDELSVTDPKATKPFTKGGGFKGTDINPTWRMKRMTEVFGPVGQGWGWRINHHWSQEIAWTLRDGTAKSGTFAYVEVDLWYRASANEIVFVGPQIGGTEMAGQADEAYKMAVTDALGKCMVALGLSADVYLGQFDDSKYRQFAEAHHAARSSGLDVEQTELELNKKIAQAQSVEDLDKVWREHVAPILKDLKLVDAKAHGRVISAVSTRKAQLLPTATKAAAE